MNKYALIALGLVALPAAARGQDAPPAPLTPPAVVTLEGQALPPDLAITVEGHPALLAPGADDPAWMKKSISFDIKDASPVDALKQVLKVAGIEDVKIPPQSSRYRGGATRISVAMKDVAVGDALRSVARMAGYTLVATGNGDKPQITLVPGSDGPLAFSFGQSGFDEARVRTLVTSAMGQAERAISFATTALPMVNLPDKRVKLDVSKKNVRDILKDLLKQAGVDYALEDGVPENETRSFTFQNVPIGTALDAVCRSIGVGWRAERKGDKVLVRIGGGLTGRLRYFDAPGNDTLLEQYFAPLAGFGPGSTGLSPEAQKELEKAMKDANEEVRKALKDAEKAQKEAMKEAEKARLEAEKARKKSEQDKKREKDKPA